MSLRRICGSIVWLLFILALAYLFFYGSGFLLPFLSGCGLAVLFYLLRSRDRLWYGMLELLAGAALLGTAIYSGTGRGPFSSALSAAFERFDARLSSYYSPMVVCSLSSVVSTIFVKDELSIENT
jgi:hypothetical protein